MSRPRRWHPPAALAGLLPLLALLALTGPATAVGANARRFPLATPVPPNITDFNGDGFADVALGAHLRDVGSLSNAGSVDVIYGSATGLQSTSPAAQLWSANSSGMPSPAQGNAEFGFVLATGDFNGDGRSDLAIGTPKQDVPGDTGRLQDAGAVYVIYGSASGLQTASPAAQYWTANSPGMPSPAVADAVFGRAVAAGDFNGDGTSDLAIGAPRMDLGSLTQAGGVYLLYGSTSGLQTTSPAAQFWTQDSPGVPDQAETNDWFGRAVGSGNFNGDAYDDLVVGVPLEDQNADPKVRRDSGAVNVLYGSAAGVQATAPAAQFWDQDSPHVTDHNEAGDYFGHNLASGDFNNDGFGDLAIGVRHESLEGHPTIHDAGAANVLYGSASGLQTDSPQNQFWTQNSKHLHDSADKGEEWGFSLAAGDFNNDGYDDVAISASFENLGLTVQAAGGVNVIYGGVNGLQADQPENQFWTQDSPNVLDQVEAKDQFGFSLAANDFNGDGLVDLAIGVVKEDLELGPTLVDAGAANVLYGGVNGLQTDGPANQFWSQDSPGIPGDPAADDNLGFAAA
jgi:hypothetical protein